LVAADGVVLTVSLFPLDRRLVAQRRVQPGAVVPVDPGEDRAPGVGSGGEPVAVHELALETGPEGLGDRVVPAHAGAPDRLAHAEFGEPGPVGLGQVLAAAVPVEDHVLDLFAAGGDGHVEGIADQLGAHVGCH
jgi:hypothetical protein